MQIQKLLPGASDAGTVRRWFLPLNNETSGRDAEVEYYPTFARFLGGGSSHTERHQDHHGQTWVPRGTRCNACRWFEARIFREFELPADLDLDVEPSDDAGHDALLPDPRDLRLGNYVIHYAGMSIVDGEVPFCRYETTPSAHAVIESMTTRRTTESGPVVFLAKPSAHALAVAAAFDVDLRDAYENRAVS